MAQPISTPQEIAAPLRPARRALLAAGAGLGAAILVGAVVLWFHYGTAVFFETIASGHLRLLLTSIKGISRWIGPPARW